jgi:phage terminase large subunit
MEIDLQTPRVFKPLLSEKLRYLGAHGGRGSGKSHFFAEMAVERMLCGQFHLVCVREVQKTLDQSVKKLIESKIQDLKVGPLFDCQQARTIGPNGSLVIYQGMQDHTAESIKSLEGYDCAWIEEAQSLSQRSLDLLRPTIRKDGSQIWASWNPRAATDPIDALLRGEDPPPGTAVVEVNWRDNPLFPDVLRVEMEYDRKRDPDKYAHVWEGKYLQRSDAKVFRNWSIQEFEAPADAVHRLGADWGFSVDPTVLVRCHIIGRKLYIDHEAYQIGCEISDTPSLFQTVPESERWPIVADSARPETISHMRKNGFPKIMPAVKGAKSVEDGVAWLQSFDIIVHPRCLHTIDELTHYSYKVDKLTDAVLPELADTDNHVIDALRYACEGARRAAAAAPRVEVTPMPTVHHWR